MPAETLKFVSPPYSALTARVPAARLEVLKAATPPAFSATGTPTFAPLTLNCTEPVRAPAASWFVSPACEAVMVQEPAPVTCTVLPLTAH